MAVVIRLTQMGKKGERKFRVVVAEKRSRRDGRPIELIGWYEKRTDKTIKKIDQERYQYWISKGALPSEQVESLMK